MNNRAFTLLELLVVITIIGILSSIVIVSMSGSTDSATIAKGKAYAQQVHALLGANAVGVWNFDEGTGTTAYDISGYNNDGTLAGDTHFVNSDIEGYALSFDGTGDYVQTPLNRESSVSMTALAWFKFEGSCTGGYASIIGSDDGNFCIDKDTGQNYLGVEDDEWYHPANKNICDEKWHLVVYTRNINQGKLYVDSELQWTHTYGTLISDSDFFIGWEYPGLYWNGLIDDVRIYSEALPSTEIQKHYVQGLKKLLSNQAITQAEYDQRMEEFNQSLVRHEQ
jgi:prepilin-type N-terminal cleavage/methylation domain-containing protein